MYLFKPSKNICQGKAKVNKSEENEETKLVE
jgi:hypothetical protein